MENLNFNYNVSINTINCINDIDFTYHIIRTDYPILHTHSDYYEFTILLEGEIINIRNGKKELVSQGSLFIAGPMDSHLLKANKDSIKILNIVARIDAVNKMIENTFSEIGNDFLMKKKVYGLSDSILNIVSKNIDIVNTYTDKDWKLTNNILKSTISSILNYMYIENIHVIDEENNKIERFKSKLNDLRTNAKFYTMCVNDLSYELGYSRTHLNRIFYSLFNMSPSEYLVKSKMKYAASLLSYSDYSIKEISELTGYSNLARLTENFKEQYGMTPSEYRKRNRKN